MRISDWSSDVCSSDLGQARRKGEAARLVGGAAREQAAGAAVGDADFGARYGKPGVERSHPRERAFAAPFEMHHHIGDERGGRDIARRLAPEQRGAQLRTRDLDDMEALFGERDSDDLELLAAARRRQLQLAALAARRSADENRLGARVVDGDVLARGVLFLALVEVARASGRE